MPIEPIIAFFLLWNLRRILQKNSPLPEWDEKIKHAMYGVVALFIIEVFVHYENITVWIWHLILFVIIGTIYFNPALFAARRIMWAVLPFAALSLFTKLFKVLLGDQYKVIDTYLDVAIIFSIVWMVAMLIQSKKQQKALEKERQKTHEEEEQKRRIAKQKEELENIVAERTAALRQQKEELEKALFELKSTQAQLIQSEKLASLGGLTAGIAHEIQNPLNFVNNFSEVNTELIAEMQEELNAGNTEQAIAIANHIKENQLKINQHGKRADTIVKDMLQHSRISTGQKEPTDINALAEEYLRLSYHGLRAKDKSFNATLKTDLDPSIGAIDIIPQDMGRVLLNLFTNAFYSVNEKKKKENGSLFTAQAGFEPTVSVSTKKAGNKIEITVRDNGLGIPQKVLDKIYQPFFTTKPTGEGTGLGLSLSYDIITKGHGGTLKVETKEGEYAAFNISLPLQTIK